MKKSLHLLVNEWERTLLCVTVIALLLYLGLWAIGFGDHGGGVVNPETRRPANKFLNYDTAFAFLDSAEQVALGSKSPFHFLLELAPERPRTVTVVKPVPVPTPTPPTPTPKPTPSPKRVRTFAYNGTMVTANGTRIALLRDTKQAKTYYARPGQPIEGFEVVDFAPEALTIRTPQGKTAVIPFTEEKVFELE